MQRELGQAGQLLAGNVVLLGWGWRALGPCLWWVLEVSWAGAVVLHVGLAAEGQEPLLTVPYRPELLLGSRKMTSHERVWAHISSSDFRSKSFRQSPHFSLFPLWCNGGKGRGRDERCIHFGDRLGHWILEIDSIINRVCQVPSEWPESSLLSVSLGSSCM